MRLGRTPHEGIFKKYILQKIGLAAKICLYTMALDPVADYCSTTPELGIQVSYSAAPVFRQQGRFISRKKVEDIVAEHRWQTLALQEREFFQFCPLLGIEVYADTQRRELLYIHDRGNEKRLVSRAYAHQARQAYDEYVQLRIQGDLASLDKAVQLAEQYLPHYLRCAVRDRFAQCYQQASMGEFYLVEAGVEDYEKVQRRVDDESNDLNAPEVCLFQSL